MPTSLQRHRRHRSADAASDDQRRFCAAFVCSRHATSLTVRKPGPRLSSSRGVLQNRAARGPMRSPGAISAMMAFRRDRRGNLSRRWSPLNHGRPSRRRLATRSCGFRRPRRRSIRSPRRSLRARPTGFALHDAAAVRGPANCGTNWRTRCASRSMSLRDVVARLEMAGYARRLGRRSSDHRLN